MIELVIEDIDSVPDDVLCLPDFILSAMVRRGLGFFEASLGSVAEPHRLPSSLVSLQYRSGTTRISETIGEIPHNRFRPLLARLALLCGVNPYAGQALFAVKWPAAGSMTRYRFSIFLCNEPTMDFWVRIYLYSIDA